MASSKQENTDTCTLYNQSSLNTPMECKFSFKTDISLDKIRELQHKFVDERDWHQYHTPRNVLLAMVGEVGELAELFQWKEVVKEGLPDWTDKEKENLSHELSDVAIYLIRLAQLCHVDLPSAIQDKMKRNAEKYPIEKSKGSSQKYTAYQ